MRISDWSSDVCSSDLVSRRLYRGLLRGRGESSAPGAVPHDAIDGAGDLFDAAPHRLDDCPQAIDLGSRFAQPLATPLLMRRPECRIDGRPVARLTGSPGRRTGIVQIGRAHV